MNEIIDVEYKEIKELEDKTTETLVAEVNELYIQANSFASAAVLLAGEVGRRLNVIKGRIGHGNWEEWSEENLTFSRRKANNMMKLAEKMENGNGIFSNPQIFADIGISKVWALLGAPEEVAEEVVKDQSARDMSVQEFTQEIKRLKEENDAMRSADEESKKKIEELNEKIAELDKETARLDVQILKKNREIEQKDEEIRSIPDTKELEEQKRQAEEQLKRAKQEMKDLRKKVKAEQDKIREEAAEKAKEAAEEETEKKIEEAIEEAMKDADGEIDTLRKEVDRLQKIADPLTAEFKVRVDDLQKAFRECIKVIEKAEAERAPKWRAAMHKVIVMLKKQVEPGE